jgi:capsular exopolysaccharide synthesis family protein
MLTSAAPFEGKSFCSISLASSLAKSGKRVLLVEADMRKPRLSMLLNGSLSRKGLSTALESSNGKTPEEFIEKTPLQGLHFLAAGPIPADAALLLESSRMNSLMEYFRKEFDFVIVDSPPVFGLPDPLILATLSDGIVFVVKQGMASLEMIESAVQKISGPRCGKILGTIFNQVDVTRSSRFGYGYTTANYYSSYGYGYYHHAEEPDRRKSI